MLYGMGQPVENTVVLYVMGEEKHIHVLCACGWQQGVLHIANRQVMAPFAMHATLTPVAEGLEMDMTGIGYPTKKVLLKKQ